MDHFQNLTSTVVTDETSVSSGSVPRSEVSPTALTTNTQHNASTEATINAIELFIASLNRIVLQIVCRAAEIQYRWGNKQ